MMEKYRYFKKLRTIASSKMNEERFILSDGCCLFHDTNEHIGFNDVDDDKNDDELIKF